MHIFGRRVETNAHVWPASGNQFPFLVGEWKPMQTNAGRAGGGTNANQCRRAGGGTNAGGRAAEPMQTNAIINTTGPYIYLY